MDRNIKVKHLLTAIALIMFVGLMGATEGYLMGNFNGNGYLRVSGGTTSTFTAGTNSPIIPGAPFETLYYKASSGTNADTLVKAVRMPDETWVAVDCLFISSSSTSWKAWNVTSDTQPVALEVRYGYLNGASTSYQLVRQAFSETQK